jgi:opacity protein-like surface antigen
MKKILIFVILLLTGISSEAQQWIGVRGGYNSSDITIDRFSYRKTDTYSSINYGLIYKVYFDKHTGLQVELNNVKRGFSYYEKDTTNIRESIELPVFTNLRWEFGNFITFANGGIYVGFAQKMKYKIKTGTGTGTDEVSASFSGRDRRFEFGFGIGAGIGLRLVQRIELFAEFRYNYGLTYLYTPKYENERVKYVQPTSMQFSFGALYKFANAKK